MKRFWIIGLIALLAGLRGPVARADDEGDRIAVPTSEAQTRIANEIRRQYHDDYANRTPAGQLELARNFQQQAAASSNEHVRQYVLLREARGLAINSGNFAAAFSIVDDTAKVFALDPNELKVTVLADAMDRALIPKPQLLENYLKVCDDALDTGNFALAKQSIILADEIVRAARNSEVAARVRPYELRVHEASRELTAAVAANNKLKVDPDDPQARLVLGRYVCFVQGNWHEGLPLLASGPDKKLSDLAQRDRQGPNDAAAMIALADDWWNLPDTKLTPQRRSHQRAAYWYRRAAGRLTGNQKTRALARIAEAETKSAAK